MRVHFLEIQRHIFHFPHPLLILYECFECVLVRRILFGFIIFIYIKLFGKQRDMAANTASCC